MKLTEWDTYNIGQHFITYLINNDLSGLEDSEIGLCNSFTQKFGPYAVYDVGDHDSNFCARCKICGQITNCIEVKILVPMDKEGESII